MGDTNFLQRPEVIAAALLGGSRGRFRSLGPSDFRVQCHGTKPSPPCVPGPPELVATTPTNMTSLLGGKYNGGCLQLT